MGLIIFQAYSLIRYVNETNYSLTKFLEALKTEDHSVYFSASKKGKSFANLFRDFNTIIAIFKRNKIEKDAQHKHFQQILEQINLGIISINKGDLTNVDTKNEILFFNRAAANILNQPRHKYWHRLARQLPWFEAEIKLLKEGGKTLLKVEVNSKSKQLSLNVINVIFLDTPYLIISFQDIHSEIEQKEIEAWHNVIRVLAHEMLNSFTPVSSLASTIKTMIETGNGHVIGHDKITDESIRDINLAATTINKRSEGLMEFVNDYRTISNVPIPKLQKTNVKLFLERIYILMRAPLDEAGILFEPANVPSKASVLMDEKLIEQVFINLISNSIHALTNENATKIIFGFEIKSDQTILSIEDNGPGISDDILNQIFIPFFTTRKNGSGIGLSLSKSIMRKHQGQLLVNSKIGSTVFQLVFNKVD